LSGKLYLAIKAFIGHRPRCALYHTALEVGVPDARFVIESAPVVNRRRRERGVVAEDPVGTSWAGRYRLVLLGCSCSDRSTAGALADPYVRR